MGETVVVIGAGPVGCLHLEVARARGASRVIMVDVQESRLRRAERFHPDLLIKSDENGSHVDRVVDFTGGWGAQVVIVACPSAKAQQEAIHMACKGGRVLLFGGLPPDVSEVPLSTNLIHYRGIHVMGAFSFSPRHHVLSIRMIAEKKIHAREYITHLLPLERFQEGIDALLRGDALKVVLKPGDFTIQV
ncbi:MAG: zinc-binding dehydrogenase [Candidatus Atribacteria bacterium]|nr:zinc-binding dehydrogenase [Candidatus Atribacteria bacterium]